MREGGGGIESEKEGRETEDAIVERGARKRERKSETEILGGY